MGARGLETTRGCRLDVRGLAKSFRARGGADEIIAAKDVSFSLRPGEAVALVGESGSGKSTVARLLLRLEQADAGEIRLDDRNILQDEKGGASLAYRSRVQMVFQDPFGSLNPVHTVAHHIERPLVRHRRAEREALGPRIVELLRTVGLEPPAEFLGRYPGELSGGQRQRVAIARALAVDPDILVADEPTSMLDVSIRMGVLTLLDELRRARGLAILLITHDLASARHLADRVLVMLRGRVVESGSTADVLENPAHPYTRALLAAIAGSDEPDSIAPHRARVADDAVSTRGCPFLARCEDAHAPCRTEDPAPRELSAVHVARCHLYPPA